MFTLATQQKFDKDIALMGYAGLRIGEVEQLRTEDIITRASQFTMIHVHLGGSNGTTKDREIGLFQSTR